MMSNSVQGITTETGESLASSFGDDQTDAMAKGSINGIWNRLWLALTRKFKRMPGLIATTRHERLVNRYLILLASLLFLLLTPTPSQALTKSDVMRDSKVQLCRSVGKALHKINRLPGIPSESELSCARVQSACSVTADSIREAGRRFAPDLERMFVACTPLLGGHSCRQNAPTENEKGQLEIDIASILWLPHSNAQRYFGRPVKTSPPSYVGEGWEFDYKDGNSTVGTRNQVLQINYKYKTKPSNWRDALAKVGIAPTADPFLLGPTTSYTWAAVGSKPAPLKLCGKTLELVILFRDLSEITVGGCPSFS
jgi:hypothetical protein